MAVLPAGLQRVIEAFSALPGVGPRTAERYAAFALRHDDGLAEDLATALSNLRSSVKHCPVTNALIDAKDKLSPLYTDPKRNKAIVAVVADFFDMVALEKTGLFHGTYHVLGGLISPIDNISPEELHIKELIKRIDDDKVKELILAFNAGVEGETTALYLQQQLGTRKVKLSRLARGLPIGLDLEYADHITLGRALEGRQTL